jgi:phospholipid/cholesterol/gamma-HCH transport system substrate-binding protein|tara:strand:+ start:441 stop:1373 length:933 start_codon:yes stop_codon:yes gene_type:complete
LSISKELRVGIVVIISLGLFYYGFNYLKGSNIFKTGSFYYAEYPNVNGLSVDDPIFTKGFRVGKVSSTKLNMETGKILVQLQITNEEIKIPSNSEAIIASSGLLGGKEINLKLGDSQEYLEINDTLSSDTEGDLIDSFTSSLEPFEKSAMDAVTSIDSVMKLVQSVLNQKNRDALDHGLTDLSITLNNLNSASAGLDNLIATEKGKLSNIITNLNTMSKNLSAFSDTLTNMEIKQTIDEANLALSNANKILTKINEGEGTMGQLVNNDTLYMNLESVSKNLDKLMIDFQEHPKRYVHFSLFGKKEKEPEP